MKIALIAPPYPLEECPSPPLGLTYIAAVCEAKGAQVEIFDYIVRGYSQTKLEEELAAFDPDIVGTNCVTMNFKQAADILGSVKKFNSKIITLMGGPHVSFESENTLNSYPQIDIIVKGEGEVTMTELLKVIDDRKKWHSVSGIAFKDKEQVITTGQRPFIQNLDALPLPARHLLPMARYQALGYPVSIVTSRGCPNQCIFCLGRRMVGQKVRFRSIEKVVDEIEDLVSHGSYFINIADDLFTANKHRVKQFCDEIVKRKISVLWSAFSRVNTVDVEILKLMKSAGCHSVSFGIESGNSQMLKRVKKGITIDQAKKAAIACKEAGIRGHASFMVGLPGETFETMTDSLNLQKELEIETAYHFIAPFPGTTVRENIADYDFEILSHDWDLYNANQSIVKTSTLSAQQMDAFVHASEEQTREDWKKLKKKYENKLATPSEEIQVGGFYRMEMIYKLLNQDFIEHNSVFKACSTAALEMLCEKISVMADLDQEFIDLTMKDLIKKGYIQMESAPQKKPIKIQEKTIFSWAHHSKQAL